MSKKIQGKEVINKLIEGETLQETENRFLYKLTNDGELQYKKSNGNWEISYSIFRFFLHTEFTIYPSIEKRINEILKRNYLKVVEIKYNSLKITFNSIGLQESYDIIEFTDSGFRVKEGYNHYGGGASFRYSKVVINELVDLYVSNNFNFLEWKDTI